MGMKESRAQAGSVRGAVRICGEWRLVGTCSAVLLQAAEDSKVTERCAPLQVEDGRITRSLLLKMQGFTAGELTGNVCLLIAGIC